jgi:hypothetical protein
VQLALTDTKIAPINGIGRVRWVRADAQGQLPRGIGVEYGMLSDVSRQALVRYLREQRVTACIPAQKSA